MHLPQPDEHCRRNGFPAGFTLLEMAVVLVIIAAVIAGTMSMGSSMVGSARLVNTNNKLDAIEKALMAYRITNNRLPCPADPTLTDIPINAAVYGTEAGNPGSCTYTNGSYTMPNYTIPPQSNSGSPSYSPVTTNFAALGMSAVEGAVPVRALGLPDEFQFDGWGRKFAYAVAAAMTTKASGTGTAGNADAFVSYGAAANCGAITVQNAGGGNRTQVADYVLLSYGPDGHGGYLKNGKRYFMGSTNSAEQMNCHCNASADSGAYSATYVQQDPTQTTPGNSLTIFDDIVRYKERWQMMNDYDHYHPGSQLPCTQGFQIQGSAGSVATGDINGDGIPDLVISNPTASPGGRTQAGAVYVIFGTRTGFPDPLPISSLNGTNGFELDGVTAGDWVGLSVATGDINGDGIADIITRAYGVTNNYAGYTYVVFGKNGTWTTPQTLNIGAGNSIDGTQGVRFDGTGSGYSSDQPEAVRAGDINGDGYADVIISGTGRGFIAGSAYVVFGKSATWGSAGNVVLNTGTGTLIDGKQGIRLDGTDPTGGDLFGLVTATGDINGDGIPDLIIGAPFANTAAGYVYMIFGKSTRSTSFLPTTTVSTTNASKAITPASYTGLMVGETLTSANIPGGTTIYSCNAGNVTTVGTVCTSNITLSANAAATASGTAMTVATTILSIGPGTFIDGNKGIRFDGVTKGPTYGNPGDAIGLRLATGDINGDGIADLIIGSYIAPNAAYNGYTYVIFGRRTSWGAPAGNIVLNTGYGNVIDGTQGVRFDGVTTGDYSGMSLATGDVNGDGIPDLIIGASQTSYSATYAGSTYVVFGKNPLLPMTTVTTTSGSNSATLASYTGVMAGQYVTSANIPAGTYISSCTGETVCTGTLTLSTAATASASGTAFTVATTPLNIGSGTLINGTSGVRFDGPAANYALGSALATGDINGDGIPDLIIGAAGANNQGGYAYIYNGRVSGWPTSGFNLGGL